MPFFRRTHDITQATARQAAPSDLTGISRLLRDTSRRFLSPPGSDLPALLNSTAGVVLVSGSELWGAVIAGWPIDNTVWVRVLVVADGLPTGAALDLLLPPFEHELRQRGVRRLFYAGDVSADNWIQPLLLTRGWVRETNVVVYEKTNLAVPSTGNQQVRVRRAQAVDLRAIMALDRLSFDPQWVKDEGILGPSIVDQPFFMIAELNGLPVGYAFATSHFNGRLIHLVRIAVDPGSRGQGIGVRLMAEVVAFARWSNAETLTLNTQQENRSAQRLYEWFGFHRTGESQPVLRRDL